MPNPFAGSASNVCLTSASTASKNSGDRNCGSRLESSWWSRACARGLAWLGAAILLAALCVPAAAQTLEPQWIQQSTSNNPGPRFESALTYDAAHGQVVLFSGNDEPADTWVWNGINWSNVTPANPANSPSARTNPAMVYDAATGNVVLFGGTDNTLSANRLNDTWVWNGSIWTNVTPANPAYSPGARNGSVMVYDAALGEVVLFGGTSGTYLGDTWEWDGSIWTEVSTTGPSPRADHSMAYDAAMGEVLLFGGEDSTGYQNDTWAWNETNGWTNLIASNSASVPSPRLGAGIAYDAQLGQVVMFGGSNGSFLDDTWVWNGTAWASPATPSALSARLALNGMTYDTQLSQVILYSGISPNTDTWEWGLPGNFGNVNVCQSGHSTPAPCNETVSFAYSVPGTTFASTPSILTQGQTGLDFSLANNSCAGAVSPGSTCTVNVTFAPKAPGLRQGAIELFNSTGGLVDLTPIWGVGQGPATAFSPGTQAPVNTGALSLTTPNGVAVDAAGDVFIADGGDGYDGTVVEVPANGTPTTIGTGLDYPQGLAVDGAGDLFIADNNLNEVVEVPAGCSNSGCQQVVGSGGLLAQLGVAVDGPGDVFIADFTQSQVVEVPANGGVQTVVYNPSGASPVGLAVDSAGDLFIADYGLKDVVEIPAGCTSSSCWKSVGTGWDEPEAVAVDAAGDVFVADEAPKIVEVPAGCTNNNNNCQITISNILAYGIAVDAKGDVFVPERSGTQVIEFTQSQPPSLGFGTANVGVKSGTSPLVVAVQNIGNAPLDFSAISFPPDFPEDGSETTDCLTANILGAGQVCTLTIDFTPTTGGPSPGTLLSETVGLTDNALNATGATQGVPVQGTALQTQVAVPNLVGETLATAEGVIVAGSDLTVGTVTNQSNNTVPAGDVISQSPTAGTPVSLGSPVNLFISTGPASVTVPNVVGSSTATATSTITGMNLVLGTTTTQYSDTVPSGTVISESPTAGTIVNGGTSINIIVSGGTPPASDQLSLENNYFVTGDYASGGVSLRGLGNGVVATGTISIADSTTNPGTQGVPDGADIVAAYLYWEAIENTSSPSSANATFQGYSITGLQIGKDVPSYSDGTYTGTLRAYRADVNNYLPINSSNQVRYASGDFTVSLPDGGTTAQIPEGASLVVIYRVISPNFPLKSVVLYNGLVTPTGATGAIPQAMVGFYDAVGGGSGTGEVTNIYAAPAPAGWSNLANSQTLGQSNQYIDTLNTGDAYAAVVLSTPVNNSDGDGILDAWKAAQGYTDVNSGLWVPLVGATSGEKDLFVQFDYMCSAFLSDGVTCDFTQPNLYPSPDAQGNDPLAMVTQAFLNSGVHLHLKPGNAILESTYTCADNGTQLCEFPSTTTTPQPGVVAWNGGVELSKVWPANFSACASNPTTQTCLPRFPFGQKDSYHYVLFGYSLAIPAWNSWFGSLTGITVSASQTSIQTTGLGSTCPSRVTISGVQGNPALNGVYNTSGCDSGLTTIYVSTPSGATVGWTYPNSTLPEPVIGITSGTVTSISGYSNVGGSDSVVSLGYWETNLSQDMSKAATVVAGTLFHELGHTLGLTHGGRYYDTPGSYVPTYEANCKPNYQSTMNYLFQLDGLGLNSAIAYSNQALFGEALIGQAQFGSPTFLAGDSSTPTPPFSTLPFGSVYQLTDSTGAAATYSTSAWYTTTPPSPTTSAATTHCDGSPLTGDTGYRVDGPVDPLSPAWPTGQNIAFDGTPYSDLRGYNDLANIDLRQVGATSDEFASLANITSYSGNGVTFGGGGGVTFGGGGGVTFGGGGGVTFGGGGGVTFGGGGGVTFGGGGGVTFGGGGGVTFGGGGGVTFGGGGGVTFGGGGGATTELDYLTANSVVRPPSSPGMTTTPAGVVISWNPPAFGVVETYTIYRNVNGTGAVEIGSVSGVNGNPPGTTFTDTNPATGTVVYTITTTLYPVPIDPTSRQSQPSVPAVMKSEQSIALSLPGSAAMSSSPLTITATAETNGVANGLQVNFAATGDCSIASQAIASGISSASVNLNSTGSCNITASQSGTGPTGMNSPPYYDAASPVSGSFMIAASGPTTHTQTINFSPLPSVQYGGTFTLSATSTVGLGVTFTTSGPCSASGATSGAGLCTVTATAAAGTVSNVAYSQTTAVESFTIYPAVLKVTAINLSSLVGQPLPSLASVLGTTYTLSGFIGTDSASAVNGVPALSSAATSSTPGAYPIIVTTGTLASTNYSFLYVDGTLTVDQPPSIASANTTTFTVGTAGTFTVSANGFPASMTYSKTGALPSGVTLSAAGVLSGTPAAGTGGSYPITITASNGVSPAGTQNFTLIVDQALAITSPNNATFKTGTSGTFDVTGTGYPASTTYSYTGTLPSGVTLSKAGVLSGTPAAGTGGVYTITIIDSDGALTNVTQSFTLTVDQAPAITSANTKTFAVGTAGTFTVTASGYPASMSYSYSGALPTGVMLSNVGILSGTPAAGTGGSYPITITASNGITPAATQSFTLIVDQTPAITSANNATFTVGTAGAFTVTTTGYPASTITESGSLPNGVTFVNNSNGTGTLSGKATVSGIYPITFTASNGVGTAATQSFTLTSETTVPASGTTCNGVYTGTFSGNITVSTGQNCIFVKGGATGNITESGGNLALSSATVSGNIVISGGTYSIGPSTTIKGSLTVQSIAKGAAQNQVCGTTVAGITLQSVGTAATIGAGTPSCPANTITGSLTLQANSAAVTVSGNSIGGSLVDQSNTAATTLSGNTVKGSLTDQGNSGASVLSLNSITGTLVVQSNSGTSNISQNTVGGSMTDQGNTALTQVVSNKVTGTLVCQSNTSITGSGDTASKLEGQCATF